jgi:hypothetical protein
MATEPDATTGSLTIADQYDAELRRYHARFMAAMASHRTEHATSLLSIVSA